MRAGRIVKSVFRPSHCLPSIICCRCVAVVSTKRGKRSHFTFFPPKPLARMTSERSPKETRTREALPQRIYFCCLGYADNDTVVVFHRPGNGAITVRPTQRAEIDRRCIWYPERGSGELVPLGIR